MSVIDKAVAFMLDIAADNKHGYDQANRWGVDYDCSSLVITAYQNAGAKVKSAGATYTGNMKPAFLKCGFKDVTKSVNLNTGAGLAKGDVLLNIKSHTAMYVGNGKIAQASINEKGTVTGGLTGDQTGREIATSSYYNYPWDCVLRYYESSSAAAEAIKSATITISTRELAQGDEGNDVKAMQLLLIGRKYSCGAYGADGDFGGATLQALKNFQKDHGLDADGICGKNTWNKLING